LFLITTGEEQGLIGAEWYSLHPLVPLNKTAADINLDSMNILGPTRDFVPLGAERSTLKNIVADIARERSLRISPDPRPEQGSFYRSDHFPFAKVGVPSISLKEGSDYIGHTKEWGEQKFREYNEAHYHQPSDEFHDDWNFAGMIQEADFALEIGRRTADALMMPKFNPNDEFAKHSKR
jgi:Zn-dependent M28 family amino/carboxypeptidase